MANRTISIKVVLDDADVSRFEGNLRNSLSGGSSALQQFGNNAKQVGLALTAAVTTPLALMAREALRVGNEYQSAMNLFQAATKASASEMAAAGAKAKQLGADLALPTASAGDAARTMTELAKSGLTAGQAMDAARGTMLLAAAAAIDEARAAEIAGNALNTFGLEASQANRVADLLAAVANAASGEITDMADALKQSGAAAKLLNVPIEDVSTAIALMAKNGILGSDAGTSLKTALINLNPHSKDAAAAMQELGFNAFDASGKLKPLRQVVDEFSTATANLTDQQKLQKIETIFGTDAMRAASIVFAGGVKVFDELKDKVTQQGAAAELAGAKTKGLAGAWEGLKSQLETGAIVLFERMEPTLTRIVQDLGDFASRAIESATAFAKANPGLADFAIKLTAAAALVGPLAFGIAGVVSAIGLLSGPAIAIAGVLLGIGAGAAAASAALTKLEGGYKELSGTTAAQVVESRKLVETHGKEIEMLESIARRGFECDDSYKLLIQSYRNLDPLTKARVDLLIAESKETSELKKLSDSLIKVKREIYEQDKLSAQIKLSQLAKDFFDATDNLRKAQENVNKLGGEFVIYSKAVRDYQELVKSGNPIQEVQIQLFENAQEKLRGLSGKYDEARGEVDKYQKQVKGVGIELDGLSKAYGINNEKIVEHARSVGASTESLATSINQLSQAGVNSANESVKFSRAWVDAFYKTADEAQKAGNGIGHDLVSGFVVGISNNRGRSLSAVTQWMKDANTAMRAEARAKSPAETTIELAKDIADGLIVGFKAKASDVAKATRDLIKSALDDVRTASAEAVALANASLKTLQYLKQADDAREFKSVLENIRKLRREMGADETAQLPKSLNVARAIQAGYEAQRDTLKRLRDDIESLRKEERDLASDRVKWAQQASADWLKNGQVVEQITQNETHAYDVFADSVVRNRIRMAIEAEKQAQHERDVAKAARDSIKTEDDRARDSIIANRIFIADQTKFHSERATAAILDHLAKQKGVTESVADAFIGLYDNVFGKLNSLIDGWTSKLGIFGDFVGTLFKGVVSSITNQVLNGLFGPQGALGKVVSGLGNALSGLVNRAAGAIGGLLGIPGLGGGGAAGAAGGAGNIISSILGIGGGATGGATSGVLGGILGALGIGGTASIAGGTTALAGGAVGLSTIGAGAAGLSGISTTTGLGVAAGAGGGGVAGILGSIGAFATSGLGIATFGIGTAAALIGTWLVKRAKQRRNDEEASGVALQDAVDLIKNTALDIDNDKLRFASGADSQALLNDGILGPFKQFINTLKTESVRNSRLTNQVRDLENLYNDLVGAAIARQQERIANAANTTTTTTAGTGGGTSDPFNFASGPTAINLELVVKLEQGTEAATKAFVVSAKSKDGRDVVIETVKIAAENGEL